MFVWFVALSQLPICTVILDTKLLQVKNTAIYGIHRSIYSYIANTPFTCFLIHLILTCTVLRFDHTIKCKYSEYGKFILLICVLHKVFDRYDNMLKAWLKYGNTALREFSPCAPTCAVGVVISNLS